MFSLLEKPQQSAPTASGTVPSATPLRGAVGARESSAVVEAPTSSTGAASTVVPAAAPATGGTVFPTTSVWGAARAPAPADETAASKAVPATGGTVFPTTSVGGAARAPAPADETAASKATPTASGTVTSATPLRGAVGARESSAGAASSDVVAEAAPSTGDTTAPDASVERAAITLTSAAGTSSEIFRVRGASNHPFDPGTVLPLAVFYYNSSWPKNGSNSNGSSSSSNDTTSNHDSRWEATYVGALMRPFDPGKGCRRGARIGKAVLGLDLPYNRGKAWRRMQHGG